VSYGVTPLYGPACNAGTPQSFRAGFPAELNGRQSYPLDGGTALSYFWQQIPSTLSDFHLQHLRWSGQRTAAPSVTGTVFGPLNFQLTVTQGNGQSTTCTVHHGAVATDRNGTVITATGNPSLDTAIATLIGPQVQLNRNPWPFYDQAAVEDAAVQIAQMDVYYADYWNIPLQGTVRVTTGSNIVTGTGTNFLTTFCNSSGVSLGYQIIVWYPTGRIFNGVPETGRRPVQVSSCQSDTQITSSSAWASDAPAGSGLQYATTNVSNSYWGYSAAPANYYDNVQAYYELYYRSGIDSYLIAARKLADRFWTCTQIDRGMAFNLNLGLWFGAQQGRSNSVSGLVLRALDTGDGHPDMWAGLHNIWGFSRYYLGVAYPVWSVNVGIDPRETGYILAQLAYCALWDQDTAVDAPGGITYQNYCRNIIETSFQTGAAGLFPRTLDSVQQAWLSWYENKSTFDGQANLGSTQAWSGSTVTLTNGSTAVTCAQSTCNFAASDFGLYNTSGGSCSAVSATCGYLPVLFTDGATAPADSSHTDPTVYCQNGCTFIDSNHFTLDRPYQGTTGTHGWVMSVSGGVANNRVVGWGQDAFLEGVLGWAFNLAGRAMACTSAGIPAGCDNTTSALAYSYLQKTAAWLQTYAWIPAQYGDVYLAGYPQCGTSGTAAATNMWCNNGDTMQNREYAGDAFRGLMNAYQQGTVALQTNLDNWYAGMWAKPGVGSPPVLSPDGQYDNSFDGSGCTGCGYYLTGPVYLSQKEFGQHFGISNQASWPAVRIGGALPSHWTTVYVSGRIGDVPDATKMQVTVTEPTGIVEAPVVCTSSPCAVTVAQTAGNPMVQVTYLSANGAALHSGQPFVVNVN
jgi:hypothetical protein